ncbi:MAG: MFS transporter [Candidatus Lokiarchaeota archaeon]|nr:MFS transporter [Candidatus Lokiarchaeota archaeon]
MAEDIKHSKKGMVSYGFNSFSREFLRIAFTTFAFFFYESELGLDVWLIFFAYFIFAIYNMFNDPIVGFLTNRPFKFTKKWGRRFPWILIGGLPWGFTYMLIFTPPTYDPIGGAWILFAWLLFTTCLFDTFHSILFVNFQSLFVDKYRSVQERRTASGIYIMIGVVGVALGSILPPFLFKYKTETMTFFPTWAIQGLLVAVITFVGFAVAIPGSREDQVTIDLYLASQEKEREKVSFFKSLLTALKQTPFIAFMAFYLLYQSLVETMQASVQYTVKYSLKMDPKASTLIFAAFLVGVLISTPFWTIISRRVKDNKKIMLISGFLLAAFTIPITFFNTYAIPLPVGIIYALIIMEMFLWGLAMGGFWTMIFPVSADVIDNAIVVTGKREEGVYTGFQQFFARVGIIIQALTFAVVHQLTGFNESLGLNQPESAIWGIHLHQALIPAIFVIVGALIFWKWYKLTPDVVHKNQEKIKEMGL